MENYINNLLFTYLPHIAFAIFWFGLITRIIVANKSIQAKSTQILARKGVKTGNNLFHYAIIIVFFGHFTLFLPEEVYHLVMTTETKRMIALVFGITFGVTSFIGMVILLRRRLKDVRVRVTSTFHDYFILVLLLVEAGLGLASVATTASTTVEEYASLGVWAQKVITFQPDAGAVIAGHSLLYKLHFVTGLLIFMLFPYTKLMHMLVLPVAYFFRSGYQLVRKQHLLNDNRIIK
ncbi:MAG: respiratory nitrate reductase subunit gamma [Bacteroidales bacterium]|nr:respiratory nitrate reductase subunit gamma [Bacteroidales bacterium]